MSLRYTSILSIQVDTDRNLLSDENFILPPGLESYSTDGDHLPLPPGRRRELDQHFYGELWEPDAHPYQGYERDPLSTLPLQARMLAHIHKHRSDIHKRYCLSIAKLIVLRSIYTSFQCLTANSIESEIKYCICVCFCQTSG